MRVGIDVSQSIFGTGVSDYTINLVRELGQIDNLDLSLFGSSLRRQADLTTLFPGLKTFFLPPSALHYLWNVAHILPVDTLIGKVDVFHASDWTQPPSRVPVTTTVHDLSPLLFPDLMAKISSVHKSRLNWAVKECSQIICVSESTADDLMHLFELPASHIQIIPEALPQRFDVDPTPKEVATVKSRFGLTDYLISVGTPQPRKNYPFLIDAFLKYQKTHHLPSHLVIVGGGGWGEKIPEHKSVVRTGFLPDSEVAALVKGSESLVMPSLYEGFGLPILLGWRQQVPVVISSVSSLPEVAGSAAVQIDPHNELDLVSGISSAIKNRQTLIKSGSQRLTNFSWSQVARLTYNLYQSICK